MEAEGIVDKIRSAGDDRLDKTGLLAALNTGPLLIALATVPRRRR